MRFVFLFLVFLGVNSYAELQEVQNIADFCTNSVINKHSKQKDPVKNFEKTISQMGIVHYAFEASSCEFFKKSLLDPNSLVLDARGYGARGVIHGAIKVISDHDDDSAHEFKPGVLEGKVNEYLEKKKMPKLENLKDKNLVIFCNGPTCYRTSWAACSLMSMGYKKENLHLFLDGYLGIKKSCLK